MTLFKESKIVALTPDPDGVETDFNTPGSFLSGSFRLFMNGQSYEPDDERYGWTELNDTTIRFTVWVPEVGDVLQGFYQEYSELSGAQGSPFHPNDTYP